MWPAAGSGMRSPGDPAHPRKGTMIQILLYLWALALSAYSMSLLLTSNFNMGNLMVWVITAASWVMAIWHRGLYAWVRDTLAGRVALLLCLAAVLVLAGVLTFISVKAYSNPPTGQEKVVVVLGAGLRKDRHSKLLRYRLDKAYEYAVAHPDTILVTAGGQGRDEWVPEGQAMRDYLIKKGLPPDRVLAETRSTSTEENFAFAKQVLEQGGFDPDGPIVYVTNAFHCYRAGEYARMAGFEEAHALPAGISLQSVPTCYLREAMAVLYYWVFRSSRSGFMQSMVGLLSLNKRFFYR